MDWKLYNIWNSKWNLLAASQVLRIILLLLSQNRVWRAVRQYFSCFCTTHVFSPLFLYMFVCTRKGKVSQATQNQRASTCWLYQVPNLMHCMEKHISQVTLAKDTDLYCHKTEVKKESDAHQRKIDNVFSFISKALPFQSNFIYPNCAQRQSENSILLILHCWTQMLSLNYILKCYHFQAFDWWRSVGG